MQAELDRGQRQDGLTNDKKIELTRLRKENKQLRLEREILKKTAAWFAQEAKSYHGSLPVRECELGYLYCENDMLCPGSPQQRLLRLGSA